MYKSEIKNNYGCYAPHKPYIVGFMSVDVNRDYHSNLSQLKFLNGIPKGQLSLDLNHNINLAIKRTTSDNGEKISLLLKFLLCHMNRIHVFNAHKKNIMDFLVITYRRTLISVMCKAFYNNEPLRIMSTLFNGCIYLCSLETTQDIQRRQSRSQQDEKFCAWGYKFEQYMLSDNPNVLPDIQRPVKENEEFSIYYNTMLGKHELIYGAQIDGLLATSGTVPSPPNSPNAMEIETILNYLRQNSFIELKTNREIQNRRQELNFKKHKLLRCWCQCYLAGLKGLLVGFRNDEGVVQKLKWFDTNEIVAYCKNEWDPVIALRFLDDFLSYLKTCYEIHLNKVLGQNYKLNNVGPISLQFEIDSNKTIKVSENYDQINDIILPEWYINTVKGYYI